LRIEEGKELVEIGYFVSKKKDFLAEACYVIENEELKTEKKIVEILI